MTVASVPPPDSAACFGTVISRLPGPEDAVRLWDQARTDDRRMPESVSWPGRTVYTGVWKRPVDGPVMVRRMNIDGDGQGDLDGHGGDMRAVLVYQVLSYQHWQRHFGRDDFSRGAFAENLTVDGLPDDQVCIGEAVHARTRELGAESSATGLTRSVPRR